MAVTVKPYPALAIIGNWWEESTLNPGLYESRKVIDLTDNSVYGGYGLGQWTNNPRDGTHRRTDLILWLRSNNLPDDSPEGQMEYFLEENTWYRNGYGKEFSNLTDFLGSDSTDLTTLVYAFMQGWEGIWNGTQDKRVQHAQDAQSYINDHINDDGLTWYNSNQYLTDSQRLNNAVLIYRWMTGSQTPPTPGPGPEPGGAKKKMPLWMYMRRIL